MILTAPMKQPAPGLAPVPDMYGSVHRSHILVVDDQLIMRRLIENFLSAAGFTELSFAEDGEQGLSMARERKPDVIVLDINMPNMDGFQVCRELRADPATASIPVIVQTALDSMDDRAQAFAAGATDLVSKPINAPELVARTRLHLEKTLLIRHLSDIHDRLEEELAAAYEMQLALLPDQEAIGKAIHDSDLRVTSLYRASSELSGDFWGLQRVSPTAMALYSADFTGHGIAAALNTARFHTILQGIEADWSEPLEVTEKANHALADILPCGTFATFIYGVVDFAKNEFRYVSAGAPQPVVGNHGDPASVRVLESSGLPLGISRVVRYEERRAEFARGSFLLLYSDALIETPDPAEPLFDQDRLTGWIADNLAGVRCGELIHRLSDKLLCQVEGPLQDDLTMVCVNFG